jgi:hypothetical protein
LKTTIRDSKAQKAAPQFDRFVETARKLGCDEDSERFEESLGKIAAYNVASMATTSCRK